MDKPTDERRIDNLRRIATDDTVNNFARSICNESADTIEALQQQVAELKERLEDTQHRNGKNILRAERAEAETIEQCRLLGMGSEREARLKSENTALQDRLKLKSK